ncbi:MAG: hypothetical protein FWB93_06990 [Oscillospiraceae bacterium]|nr:hypothetical protein [Oscillospiraceae bacterium]MCL2213561.1 hypothetical protein [Oscillospiraceae bacterium]
MIEIIISFIAGIGVEALVILFMKKRRGKDGKDVAYSDVECAKTFVFRRTAKRKRKDDTLEEGYRNLMRY